MMRRREPFILFIVALVLMIGCVVPSAMGGVRGSGDLTTVEKDYSGFARLDVHHGCDLNVIHADSYSIVVKIDDNLIDYLKVELEGDTLVIGMESGRSYSRFHLKADITMPDIERLEMSGGSKGRITGFHFEHPFRVGLSGGSELSGVLDTGDVQVSASGGAEVDLQGSGDDLTVNGSGGAEIRMADFRALDVDVDLSGGSQAAVTMDGTLTGRLSGGATVYYSGTAALGNLQKSGGGRAVKK